MWVIICIKYGNSITRLEKMTIYGLGPIEIIMGLSFFSYVCYNMYMVWKESDGDMEY